MYANVDAECLCFAERMHSNFKVQSIFDIVLDRMI